MPGYAPLSVLKHMGGNAGAHAGSGAQADHRTTRVGEMPDAVALVSAGTGVIVEVNPSWDHLFGYDADGLVGHHMSEITVPSGERVPGRRLRAIVECVRRGDVWRGRITHVRKDGSQFVSVTSVSGVEDGSAGPLWMVVASRTDPPG
jgi:PAS domain S-box-containing protein